MTYSYPLNQLAGDYVRAGVGLLLTGTPVLLVSLAPLPFTILSLLAALFLGYGVHTALCHRRRIGVNDDYIWALPAGVRLNWQELTEVKLDFYSTHKESSSGWLKLTLRSGNKRLRIDSRLDGFRDVARRAAVSVHANGLCLSPTSAANFAALDIDLAESSGNSPRVSDG